MNHSGIVFDIQRFSIHDGPGIRTIVFLKGCPLSCLWCSNPESQKMQPELFWNPDKCIKCNMCGDVCQVDAVSQSDYSHSRIIRDRCIGCGKCAEQCPTQALTLKGKPMSVEEVYKEVEKDRRFYMSSGGGVTISGGEPFSQPEFLLSLLKKFKDAGISTAIETTGMTCWSLIHQCAECIDYFLYDIKHMDSEMHKKYTGIENNLILSNLKLLANTGKDITVRVPYIPGYNADVDHMKMIASFMNENKLKKIELLPYHNFGESKYQLLNRPYTLSELEVSDMEQALKDSIEVLKVNGLEVVS
jgi:pyruvate formate lyase activating enzyme